MAHVKPLLFPNEDTLRVALTSGMIPPERASEAVEFWRTDDGTVGVRPASALGKQAAQTLASAGVIFGEAPTGLEHAACWAAVLTPEHVGEQDLDTDQVLFLLDGERPLLDLSAELLRLGCDRQTYQFLSNGSASSVQALLRAADPPYYTVASATDHTTGYRAFVPVRPGQELVWVELGYQHPLAEHIQAAPGEIVAITGDGRWLTFSNTPWSDIYQLIDFKLPGGASTHQSIAPPRRLEVPLRLARASRNESPSLWIVRTDAVNQVDQLVQTIPDDIIARLLFAVGGDPEDPTVMLRARMGRSGPPQIDVAGESYVPLLQITNLYVPRDAIIEPPLRRDKLRELLAPSDEEIAWLAPDADDATGGFHVESIDDAAFAPLSGWVDYLVHSEAVRLEPWIRSVTFDFDAFQSVGREWAEGPPVAERKPQDTRSKDRTPRTTRKRAEDELRRIRRRRRNDTEERPRVEVDLTAGGEQRQVTPEEEELEDLQQEFLELDAPADDPQRLEMWVRMAELNTRVGELRDTGLCWTRALWELDGEAAAETATWWAEAEGVGTPESKDMVAEILHMQEPSLHEVRSVIADLIATEAAGQSVTERFGPIADLQDWLDRHDDVLDVRSIWLARMVLARQTGDDRLAAVRTRDRLLRRLATGLSLEKDVPTFLRFVGGGSAAEGSVVQRLLEHLERFYQAFQNIKRKRSAVEAPEELTAAYVSFVFAYGFARLGQSERARVLRDAAMKALDVEGDPIHGFLARAYSARIDQALEGRPSGTPLPTRIAGELNELEKFPRYKVDRLRQASNILESHERLDPVRAFQRGEKDPRGEEFAELRGMTDNEQLAARIDELIGKALQANPEERDRLFDGAMDFFPQLPSRAVPHLQTILGHLDPIEPSRRALLLEESLMLAGFFGRSELVRDIATRLQGLVGELNPEQATTVAGEFGHALRSLRRVGLREEAADLLDTMNKAVSGDGVQPLVARLHMAAGLAYLGDLKRAEPILNEAHTVLVNDPLTTADRLRLVRATAVAWSQTPHERATTGLTKLGDELARISDSYNTNSHFCLSVVEFVESIVLGYASEDLAMGELGRRWLDEDEYLVRRRIHQDLGALS